MPAKLKIPPLTGLPKRRTMRRSEAVAFLGGEEVLRDAVKAKLLRPCCEKPGGRQTFFRTADVVAVESDIDAGRYPGAKL